MARARVLGPERHERVNPMSHLEDRLAEFVFEELSAGEMETARQHVARCMECQGRVAEFRGVRDWLGQSPDVDVPRRTVFVPEAPRKRFPSGWGLAWTVPTGLAAAVLLAVVWAGPFQLDWDDAGLRIAFGAGADPEAVATALPAIDYDSLDYSQIEARIQPVVQARLESVLAERDAEWSRLLEARIEASEETRRLDLLRVRADMGNLYDGQRSVERDIFRQNAALQEFADLRGLE